MLRLRRNFTSTPRLLASTWLAVYQQPAPALAVQRFLTSVTSSDYPIDSGNKANNLLCRNFADFSSARYFSSNRTVKVPSMGDSITEGSINEWKKPVGEFVERDELVAIIDTDKVSVDINSPESGYIRAHHAQPGDTILVGQALFDLEPSTDKTGAVTAAPADTPAPPISAPAPPSSAPASPASTPASPASTPASPASSGSTRASSSPTTATPTSKPAALKPAVSGSVNVLTTAARTEEVVPMSRLRKRVAERLKHAQNNAASLTTFNECDMSQLMLMRSDLNKSFSEQHGLKFGFVSAFLHAASRCLMKMPQINGYIAENGTDIVYKNYVDISVAVATKTGLLVPVIRDCEKKSIADLEKDLSTIAVKAREGKIELEEMAGGTFTISNGGVFGSLFGTPIINFPQSSILGLHSIKEKPVVRDGDIVIRPIMYLALTYDHRIVDGRESVTFLNLIKDKIEDPRKMLLDI